ncbi:MAG: HD domain-containing protein [Acholeplasmatales bacterium]|nr:HD domain-containing protein [Acholeplasmatales bacterium]
MYQFERLERTKVFRDPIYGYINVDYKIIARLIDTYEFQRLRRIRQLSGVSMVFQTAEHSRFTHSLGAYELANLCLKGVEGLKESLSEYEQLVFLISALLHDIGHGPYSHAFEHIMQVSHEEMTVRLILGDTEINKILREIEGLDHDVASVIAHEGKYPLIESLTSSQLDVDRMDYLSRDAYFTGASYGNIDFRRIIRSLMVKEGKLYLRASGVNSVESYIMARYHMYWQVYYHPVARAYELLLQSIYKRVYDLTINNVHINASVSALINVIKNSNDLASYVLLDDSYVNGMIKQLTSVDDDILRDLALSFEKRHLYKYREIESQADELYLKQIRSQIPEKYLPYYYIETKVSQRAYLHVESDKYDINDIKIITPAGDIISLEEYSPIIRGLISSASKTSIRVFYKELLCKK